MGGWPEDLQFLDQLLTAHPNLHLDSSATKWIVRELSKHTREELLSFLTKWEGRILFGSDKVTRALHIEGNEEGRPNSKEDAFELYASRYYALRTLWEGDYEGESPIADPDLNLVAPEQFSEDDAPLLCGKSLPIELLESLYYKSAKDLFLK